MSIKNNRLLVALLAFSLLASGCVPPPPPMPTLTAAPLPANTVAPTLAPINTIVSPNTALPTLAPTAAAAPIPLPALSLKPGSFYFSVEGQTRFIFSRNAAAYFNEDLGTLLDWALYNGDRMLRVDLQTSMLGGYGYTNTGQVDPKWAQLWDAFLTQAEAHGLYVLPTFTGWANWNDTGFNTWPDNPFNPAKGGPAKNRIDIFQPGSPSQGLYLQWVQKVVTSWQSHKNIAAWEVLDEGNLTAGVTEQDGIAFTEAMAKVIRSADPYHRPITASLADDGKWPNYYNSPAIDLIQIHPYPDSAQLDRVVIDEVRRELAAYHKPVLIGESGLNAASPLNYPPHAQIGVEHAIWADVVSGAMNGRALWWEDGYGLFFQQLRMIWVNKYADAELPAVRFTSNVDFTGFQPLSVRYPAGARVWGAAVGSASMALGWFRDAASEPPGWPLLPNIHGQAVAITVPGSARNWQVDFYDPHTGYVLPGSTLLTRQGDHVTVPLPDFTDDIAFKLYVNTTGAILPPQVPTPQPTALPPTNTDPIAGQWLGSIFSETSSWAAVLHVTIQPNCQVGRVCGVTATDWCSIDLVLSGIQGDTLTFDEKDVSSTSTCAPGGIDHLLLQPDGTLLYRFEAGTSGGSTSNGVLYRSP